MCFMNCYYFLHWQINVGISKIVAECKKMNRSVPQFSTDFGGLMVTFNAIEFKSTEIIFDVIKDNSNVTIQELADPT